MIGRVLCSLFILVTTLTGVAFQRAQQPQLRLIYFKATWCGQCHQFKAACENDPCFSQALKQRYQCLPAVDADVDPQKTKAWQVTRFPTFIVIDSAGREVNRVVGFTSPAALLQRLAQRPPLTVPPKRNTTPRRAPSEHQRPTVPDEVEQIREANEALSKRLREQMQLSELLKEQAAHAEKRNRDIVAEFRDQLKQLKEAKPSRPAEPQVVEPPQPKTPPADGPGARDVPNGGQPDEVGATPADVVPIAVEDILAEMPPEKSDTGGLLKSAFRHGVAIAIEGGLTAAQAEILVPLVAAGGPAGAAAAAGWWLLKRRRRRKTKEGAAADDQPSSFPEDHLPMPRDLDEARQLLRLRATEGRHPIHDGLFGMLAEAELESLIEHGDRTALQLREQIYQRMNEIAPLSTDTISTTT